MSEKVEFVVGSHAFFSKFPDFKSKDKDFFIMTDKAPNNKKYSHVMIGEKDYFIYKKMTKMELIDTFIKSKLSMQASCFLVPDVIKYFGVTMTDLDILQNVFYHMDYKHSYVKMIYDYYRKNNGFFLTSEQLKKVYDDYKSKRINCVANTSDKNPQ